MTDTYHILLAEDELNQREVFKMVFASRGYAVTAVENGIEVLSKLKEQSFDIIVCDISMPVMGGIELVQKLKSTPDFSSIPVLLLTAALNFEKINYQDLGADDFCDKCVKRNILLGHIERLLPKKNG